MDPTNTLVFQFLSYHFSRPVAELVDPLLYVGATYLMSNGVLKPALLSTRSADRIKISFILIFLFGSSPMFVADIIRVITDKNDIYFHLFRHFIYVLSLIADFAAIYTYSGVHDNEHKSISRGYLECLYFSIITWTTVGYGDFVPASKSTRLLACYEALLGYFAMSALFAELVAVMTSK